MEWQTILGSGLISVITAGGISLFAYSKQKAIDYRQDYKKYILSKRQASYEKLEEILRDLSLKYKYDSGTKQRHRIYGQLLVKGGSPLLLFSEKISQLLSSPFWVTDILVEDLEKLNSLIRLDYFAIHEYADSQVSPEFPEWEVIIDNETINRGEEQYQAIEIIRLKLTALYLADIKNLSDIDSFLKNKMHT